MGEGESQRHDSSRSVFRPPRVGLLKPELAVQEVLRLERDESQPIRESVADASPCANNP